MKKGKYILGLNGWFKRSHDASACIVKDGKILAMAEEERFVRKKHAYDKMPLFSTLWCLEQVGITLDDIDTVAIGWNYPELYKLNNLKEDKIKNISEVYFPRKYFSYEKKPKFIFVNHHLAHAACSYYLSGMDSASILVIDGQGENVSTTLALGKGNRIEIKKSFPVKDSLGYFYETVSDYIGLGSDAAGKLMGLAPYGKAKYKFKQIKLLEEGYQINIKPNISEPRTLDQQAAVNNAWKKELFKMFGEQNKVNFVFRKAYGDTTRELKLNQLHKDIAASTQEVLEKTLAHIVKLMVKQTGVKNVCLSGGVALNCSTNTIVARLNEVDKLFVPPMTNDVGSCLGAALYVGGVKPSKELKTAYFGPEFSNKEVEEVLKKVGCKYSKYNNIEEVTANLLAKGKIVSWFQGALEVGPRALGNRSILANPKLKNTNHDVNFAKSRELWRPLAPSILIEDVSEYLDDSFPSPFMLHTFTVKEAKRKEIPAVTHVDFSTRPQTVSKEQNPKYYKLIKEFKRITGTSVVLNTSFNGAKEAIVCTPMDAIASFFTNSTDYLVINDFLISK